MKHVDKDFYVFQIVSDDSKYNRSLSMDTAICICIDFGSGVTSNLIVLPILYLAHLLHLWHLDDSVELVPGNHTFH